MLVPVPKEAVVFDGDDTLWSVEYLFDAARTDAAAIVASAGLDGAAWERIERNVDVENVSVLGFSPDRFPTSCVQAYRTLAQRSRCRPRPEVETRIWRAAEKPFFRLAKPAPHATEVLASLRIHFRLALLTKGDIEIQWKRIRDAHLEAAFDQIMIVAKKDAGEFRDTLRLLDSDARSAWSVGNSLASDINPALRIGMKGLWIDAPVWEYERREVTAAEGQLVTALDLKSAARVLLDDVAQ